MAIHDDEPSGKAIDPRLLRRLLSFARPHARGFVISTVLLLLHSGLTILSPRLVGLAIDDYLKPGPHTLTIDERASGLWTVSLWLFLIVAAAFVLRYAQVLITNLTGQKVIHDLRRAVYEHIVRRSLKFFDRHPVGTLVTRVTNDIETLNEFFLSGIDVLFSDFIRILAITGVLFALDWRMALTILGIVPFIVIWSFVFQRRARVLFRRVRKEVSHCNAFTNESIGGIRVVRSFGRERHISNQFAERNHDLKVAHLATVKNFSWFYPGMETLSALGTSLVLLVGYHLVLRSEIEAGTIVAFWLYLAMFIEPLRQIADRYNILQSAVASGERVFRILDDETTLPQVDEPRGLIIREGNLRFEGVSFSYDGKTPVLQSFNLDVPGGSSLAIVGPTGSGKTTIINLLSRFYDPQNGRITIDGCDLKSVQLQQLRAQVGIVLQDAFLFDGSLRENLTLGVEEIDDDKLQKAIEAGQARSVVERLGGLDGRIGERGAGLSAGEKQLLSFVRTLAHDPKVLVLDEATAHVDTETETLLQTALEKLLSGRTAIVIAHRLSTIQDCDRIVVLHKGEIRESGTHQELLNLQGVYSRLYRLQFSEAG